MPTKTMIAFDWWPPLCVYIQYISVHTYDDVDGLGFKCHIYRWLSHTDTQLRHWDPQSCTCVCICVHHDLYVKLNMVDMHGKWNKRGRREQLWSRQWAMATNTVLYIQYMHYRWQYTHRHKQAEPWRWMTAHTCKLTPRICLTFSQPMFLFWHCLPSLCLPLHLSLSLFHIHIYAHTEKMLISHYLVSKRGPHPNPWLTISFGGDNLI